MPTIQGKRTERKNDDTEYWTGKRKDPKKILEEENETARLRRMRHPRPYRPCQKNGNPRLDAGVFTRKMKDVQMNSTFLAVEQTFDNVQLDEGFGRTLLPE